MTFADHHRYSRRDIAAVADRVKSSGAEAVLTTDKDAVRLDVIDQIPFALYRVPLTIAFDPPDVLFASVAAGAAMKEAIEYLGRGRRARRRAPDA